VCRLILIWVGDVSPIIYIRLIVCVRVVYSCDITLFFKLS
jgi:hypothetical protein